jgi:hypothetical protein
MSLLTGFQRYLSGQACVEATEACCWDGHLRWMVMVMMRDSYLKEIIDHHLPA